MRLYRVSASLVSHIMLQDTDRRVREASHCTFQEIVTRVGRDLAPYLKQVLGAWLVAQCDPYAPAATAAQQAFSAAFPPAKQISAMLYCKDVVIAVSVRLNLRMG